MRKMGKMRAREKGPLQTYTRNASRDITCLAHAVCTHTPVFARSRATGSKKTGEYDGSCISGVHFLQQAAQACNEGEKR